jgi:hypothetical protein
MDRLLESYADASPSAPGSGGIHVNFYDEVITDDDDVGVVPEVYGIDFSVGIPFVGSFKNFMTCICILLCIFSGQSS